MSANYEDTIKIAAVAETFENVQVVYRSGEVVAVLREGEDVSEYNVKDDVRGTWGYHFGSVLFKGTIETSPAIIEGDLVHIVGESYILNKQNTKEKE